MKALIDMRCWRCAVAAVALVLLTTAGMQALAADDTLATRFNLPVAESPVRDHPRWRSPQRIIIPSVGEDILSNLQAAAPGVELIAVGSREEALARVADADGLIGFCDEALLRAGTRLRWVQLLTAGVEQCVDLDAIQAGDVLLTNMQGVTGAVIAEHVLAMMLSLNRGLHQFMVAQQRGHWARGDAVVEQMTVLQGKTLLVVGLGGIGTEVAERAHALGMRVVATRGSRREGPDFVSYVGLSDEVLDLAREADVVVNATPLTDATRGLFDAAFFEAMPSHALFINVGRGGSVVTDDLVVALGEGHIAGAGLDVHDPTPLPSDHPLWRLPNVVITPHVAARTDIGREERWLVTMENLRRYVQGERMLAVVDPERQY
ncbi:MAG: D-2-hydroxyacid dehydrogenase [Gammaproteobacteria bacterium]|nr:D-2-hydroxyacid dehydrogenase [Gammaproteobacteria bacterium]